MDRRTAGLCPEGRRRGAPPPSEVLVLGRAGERERDEVDGGNTRRACVEVPEIEALKLQLALHRDDARERLPQGTVTLLFAADRIALSRVLGGNDGVEPWAFPLVAFVMVGISLLVGAAGSGITLRRFLRI